MTARHRNLIHRDVLLRKAPPWRYEREWRLLGNKGVQDSSLELADVTFELRCPEALKHALVSALEPRAVKFFEMYEITGTFKLKRKLLDTDELRAYFPKIARSGVRFSARPNRTDKSLRHLIAAKFGGGESDE